MGNVVHLNIPLQNRAELWGAEGLKTRQRGKHQVKTAGKTQTWCSNPGTQEVEAGGQQAPDQPYSYKVRLCLKK